MKRRVLLASLAALPATVRAQGGVRHRVGILLPGQSGAWDAAIRDELRRLDLVEGRDIVFEVRAAQGQLDRLPALAAELVRLPVDLILARQTPATIAAKAATQSIPIVMISGDALRTGVVGSLARPGGNITGMSGAAADLGSKLLSLVRDAFGRAQRIGVLANDTDLFTAPFLEELQGAERAAGVTLHVVRVAPGGDYREAFAAFARLNVQAVIVQPSLRRARAIELANALKLPTASPLETFAAEGGVIAYAAQQRELARKLAWYIDRVLKGAKPADLPVEQPTEYGLIVNLKAARALGIEIPLSLLVRADELIE